MTTTLTQPKTTHPDNSWYWPHFDAYRDSQGRTLEEAENEWLSNSDLSPDEVAQIRQQRAEAQQAALEMEQVAQGAEIASTAANIPGISNALEGEAA